MSQLEIFVFGGIGAIAPEILRWRRIVTSPRPIPFRHPVLYVLVSLLFVALGGALAIAFESQSRYAALYVGLAAPTLVSAGLGKSRRTGSSSAPPAARERGGTVALAGGHSRLGIRRFLGALNG